MRRWLGRILMFIGAGTVALFVLLVIVALRADEPLPDRMALEVDLRKGLTEHTGDHPIAMLRSRRRLTVRELVTTIERAAGDDRVEALVGRLSGVRLSLAHVQELADAVTAFRASGKPTFVFAETLGGLTPANGAYLLASAFEAVHLQPSGSVGLVGLSAEHPFLAGTLDSLGIVPVFGKRQRYKHGPNVFTENAFTADHRESVDALLSDQFDQLVDGIAEGRGVSPEAVRQWIDDGPHTAQEALADGLVDNLSYVDGVHARMGETERVPIERYAAGSGDAGGTRVALIYAVGTITTGKSRTSPLGESESVGSDTVVEAFRQVLEDGDARAVLLRVDSPGGSYVASDAIWRATRLAQAEGLPVVVSIASSGASGGYLIATHADRVIAQPGTLTGSIGVWAGKFVTRDFWQRLGVTWDDVAIGAHARLGSSLSDFTPAEREQFDAQLDRVYGAFTAQVGEGRELDSDRLDAAAEGRVWTGRQAVGRGLVDRLGGFPAAIEEIRMLLGLDPDAPVDLKVYPKPRDLADQILEGDWASVRGSTVLPTDLGAGIDRVRELVAGPITWTPWLGDIRH